QDAHHAAIAGALVDLDGVHGEPLAAEPNLAHQLVEGGALRLQRERPRRARLEAEMEGLAERLVVAREEPEERLDQRPYVAPAREIELLHFAALSHAQRAPRDEQLGRLGLLHAPEEVAWRREEERPLARERHREQAHGLLLDVARLEAGHRGEGAEE